jgi:tRNA (guanine37-N1)-methyltransferase
MKENNSQYSYDILGNILLLKFPKGTRLISRKKIAKELLKKHKSIETALEKVGKFSGRLRKQSTKYLAGKKTKDVIYKENNCIFRFNIDETYFSSRLSNERKEIAKKIKKNEEVMVMFAGVSPYSIVIAKNSKARRIDSNEINRKANEYASLNIELNKVKKRVFLLPGDIKRVAKKLNKKYDVIVMPRPQLKDSFLQSAFKLSKRGTRIYYYDFCKEEDYNKILEKIKLESKKSGKKIKINCWKKAGEIGPYKMRIRVDFEVL